MKKSDERELFLKYIIDVYFKNHNFSVSPDIIYSELARFNVCDGKNYIVDNDSLVSVQVALNNKFKNSKVNTFMTKGGYFWVIENRCEKNDNDFYTDITNSIKLYISVDSDNIFKISESLFNFMINENIIMQCKVAKNMRNDALVCRIVGREAAIKVSEYVNKLNYDSKYKPNPFLLDDNKVSAIMDGNLSYNSIISKLLYQYLSLMHSNNLLDKIDCNDFCNFIKKQISVLNSGEKDFLVGIYNLSDENKYNDFIMICDFVLKNLSDCLSLDDFFDYKETTDNIIEDTDGNYLKHDEDKLLYVINSLTNYYSVEEIHNIIMRYIDSSDDKYFTRRNDIRYVVNNSFTSEYLKKVISCLGWRAFIDACKCTYDKYGEEQLSAAIKDIFCDAKFEKITNDHGIRSKLALVIPYGLLKEVLISKLEEGRMSISSISLTNLVLDEISK